MHYGCQKEIKDIQTYPTGESDDLQASESSLIEYQYFIDLVPADPYEFDVDNDTTSLFLVESHSSTLVGYEVLLKIHTFTDREKYYEYSDSLELYNLRIYGEMIDRWAYIADSLNIDSLVAGIDSVPSWWYDIQMDVYYQYFPEDFGAASTRGYYSTLYRCWRECPLPGGCSAENCNDRVAVSLYPYGVPRLWWYGLKNKVSCYSSGLVLGVNMSFRKSWFRGGKIFEQWDFYGLQCVDLCGDPMGKFNNRGNSWWNAGW